MMEAFKIDIIQMALEKAMEKVVQEKLGILLTGTTKVKHKRPLIKKD